MLFNTPRDLGAAIRERRKALGWDQVELAARGGAPTLVDPSRERKLRASLGLLLRTLNALGMKVSISRGSAPQPSTEQPLAATDLDAVIARARRGASPK